MKPRPPLRFRPGSRVFRVAAGRLYVGRVTGRTPNLERLAVRLLGGSTSQIDATTARRWGTSPADARRRTARMLARKGEPR
jgi:hypothetical protein